MFVTFYLKGYNSREKTAGATIAVIFILIGV